MIPLVKLLPSVFCTIFLFNSAFVQATPSVFRVSAESIKGVVINSITKEPVPDAVINVSWSITSVDENTDKAVRRLNIIQVTTDENGKFEVAGWLAGRKIPKDWYVKPGSDPVITIFSNGYYHEVFHNKYPEDSINHNPVNPKREKKLLSVWDNKTFLITPYPDYTGRGLYAGPKWSKELEQWVYFVKQEIASYEWRNVMRAKHSQPLLIKLLEENCFHIHQIQQSTACVELAEFMGYKPPLEPNPQEDSLFFSNEKKPTKKIILKPGFSVE